MASHHGWRVMAHGEWVAGASSDSWRVIRLAGESWRMAGILGAGHTNRLQTGSGRETSESRAGSTDADAARPGKGKIASHEPVAVAPMRTQHEIVRVKRPE